MRDGGYLDPNLDGVSSVFGDFAMIFFRAVIIALFSGALAGCVAGAVGQAVVSETAGAALQTSAAQRMSCEQIQRDIAARNLGKVNPLAIPNINRQVARMEAVARQKGCPGFTQSIPSSDLPSPA